MNKIKMERKNQGMTQHELASAVGVTRQTIGLIESDNYNPSINLCRTICFVLGKTLDELFWDKEIERKLTNSQYRWYAFEVDEEDLEKTKEDIESVIRFRNYHHIIPEVKIINDLSVDFIFVKMIMIPESWHLINSVPGIKSKGKVIEKEKFVKKFH